MNVRVRKATAADADAIRALHVTVAQRSGGLARFPDEITSAYVHDFVTHALEDGIIVVAECDERAELMGEVHTYRHGLRRFAHMLSNLTVAVHPDAQGMGVGRQLFQALLGEVRSNRPEILRVELIVQESNARARRLYESVGFREEGRLVQGILDAHTLQAENDVPMAWLRERDTA